MQPLRRSNFLDSRLLSASRYGKKQLERGADDINYHDLSKSDGIPALIRVSDLRHSWLPGCDSGEATEAAESLSNAWVCLTTATSAAPCARGVGYPPHPSCQPTWEVNSSISAWFLFNFHQPDFLRLIKRRILSK